MTVWHRRSAGAISLSSSIALSFLGLLVIGTGLLSGCDKNASAASSGAPPAMKVTVVKARQTDVPVTGEWVGTLDGYVNAQIQPQANGYLIHQDYREGSQVQEGQVLFEIDPRPFEAALGQAQGQLGQAQAQLALAQINVKRDTPLAEARAIARSQLDNETQQQAQAQAAVKTAEAAVATANLNLGFTRVRSLITGVAGQAATQVGNLVSTQSILTSVSQLDPIKVYFSISESEYLALTKRAGVRGSDLLHGASKIPLTLTLSNGETIADNVNGYYGAQFFGYAGKGITSITITNNSGNDFAICNFYFLPDTAGVARIMMASANKNAILTNGPSSVPATAVAGPVTGSSAPGPFLVSYNTFQANGQPAPAYTK